MLTTFLDQLINGVKRSFRLVELGVAGDRRCWRKRGLALENGLAGHVCTDELDGSSYCNPTAKMRGVTAWLKTPLLEWKVVMSSGILGLKNDVVSGCRRSSVLQLVGARRT